MRYVRCVTMALAAVISDAGQMTATAATDRHTFVLFGACARLAGGGK